MFLFFEEMASGCETFLSVFFNVSNVKVYIHETIHVFTKSISRSTRGSSIRIDRFVFGLTLNSNKLDEKVKVLRK